MAFIGRYSQTTGKQWTDSCNKKHNTIMFFIKDTDSGQEYPVCCMDSPLEVPAGETYRRVLVRHTDTIDSTALYAKGYGQASKKLPAKTLFGIIQKGYPNETGGHDPETASALTFAVINAFFENETNKFSLDCLRGMNDKFVNGMIAGGETGAEISSYIFYPLEAGVNKPLQRLAILGKPITGKVRFRKTISSCDNSVSQIIRYQDYGIEIDGKTYPFGANGYTTYIELVENKYDYKEVRLNQNATALILDGNGTVNIGADTTQTISVVNHATIDCNKLNMNLPTFTSPKETTLEIKEIWDNLRCYVESVDTCHNLNCTIVEIVKAFWQSWKIWLCYFLDFFNELIAWSTAAKNWFLLLSTAICCLQQQLYLLNGIPINTATIDLSDIYQMILNLQRDINKIFQRIENIELDNTKIWNEITKIKTNITNILNEITKIWNDIAKIWIEIKKLGTQVTSSSYVGVGTLWTSTQQSAAPDSSGYMRPSFNRFTLAGNLPAGVVTTSGYNKLIIKNTTTVSFLVHATFNASLQSDQLLSACYIVVERNGKRVGQTPFIAPDTYDQQVNAEPYIMKPGETVEYAYYMRIGVANPGFVDIFGGSENIKCVLDAEDDTDPSAQRSYFNVSISSIVENTETMSVNNE